MRKAIGPRLRTGITFLKGWRRAAAAGYRRRPGLGMALPIVWGCLEAYLLPRLAMPGFLATALFLEGRNGKRLAWQAFLFTAWTLLLAARLPDAYSGNRDRVSIAPGGGSVESMLALTGMVSDFPSHKRVWSFTLSTQAGDYRVKADTAPFAILPGQRIRGVFRKVPVDPATNPGQFDYPAYLRSQHLAGVLQAGSLYLIEPPGRIERLIILLHQALESGLERSIPPARLPLLRATLLGMTDDLDPGLVEDFKAAGMVHILSISGQHVGIIALILLQVFAFLRLPRKAGFLATGAMLALYVPVCGAGISVLRAGIMFWSYLPAVLWERPGSAANNLGWAAAISLAWMPWQILSLGFQLSFAATFLLILYAKPLALLMWRAGIAGAAAAFCISTPGLSLVLYLGLYPILASAVHLTAPSSILGNLATALLCSGMLTSACLALIFAPLPAVAGCFGETAGAFASLLSSCVHLLAHWPGAALSVPALSLFWSAALLFLVLAFPYAIRTRKALPLALLGAAAFSGRWFCGELRQAWRHPAGVAFLDVGQGDGALCRLPGADILIDAGPPHAGRNAILPYLRHEGINRLDLAVITHPDLDHYGGLAYVAERIRIGKVIYSGEDADTHAWRDLRALLAARGIPMVRAARGQGLYASPGISLSVLSPERTGQFPDRNENSVVSLLCLGDRRFLFTGDMGPQAESRLLEESPAPDGGGNPLAGSVLKVPHHGSDLSNTQAFLEAVRPGVAVLSAGRMNRFGHPGPATVDRLHGLGARIFLTARDGAVEYRREGGGESWSTYLEPGKGGPADAARFAGRENNRRSGGRSGGPSTGPAPDRFHAPQPAAPKAAAL